MYSSYTTVILVIVCAIFYYRAGEYENSSGLVWCALSVAVSLVIWLLLRGGFLWIVLGQVGLFVAITIYRVWRKT